MPQLTPADQPINTPPSLPSAMADLLSPLPSPLSSLVVTGADVKRLRGRVGATQADLANELGYSRSSICRWESRPDKAIPSAQIDKTLAFFRARYDVAENRRVQLADLEQRLDERPARRSPTTRPHPLSTA
jgi:DNA-binding XRE family transcriptional regulator